MRPRVYLALALILGVALAAVLLEITPLQHPHAGADRVLIAELIAKDKWGTVCANQPINVHRGDLPSGVLARASYRFTADGADDPRRYYQCEIIVRRAPTRWRRFCSAMVHEIGHLAGWRARPGEEYERRLADGRTVKDRFHSANPRSVMYPTQQHLYSRCRATPSGSRPAVKATNLGGPPAPRPLVLLLPGGGWQHADRTTMAPWVDDFQRHGIEARAISYPLRTIVGAIEYVASIAAGETRPIICYGISAGGTICAGAAATGAVEGAVSIAGPTDFTRWASPAGLVIMRQIGMRSRAQKIAASPYWRLNGRQTPQLVQCGVADPLVEYTQCQRYASAAWRGNPDTTLDRLLNGHGQGPGDRDRAREWIVARWPP